MTYRVVQPWGKDKGREATLISEHAMAADAFEALECIAQQADRTGGRIEDIELLVTDATRNVIRWPGVQ